MLRLNSSRGFLLFEKEEEREEREEEEEEEGWGVCRAEAVTSIYILVEGPRWLQAAGAPDKWAPYSISPLRIPELKSGHVTFVLK